MAKPTIRQVYEIYMHRNRKNGKAYIGQTKRGVRNRLYCHESAARHGGQLPFQRAIRRHGIEAFETLVLAVCFDAEAASEFERALIAEYQTFGKGGYNATLGGEGTVGVRVTARRRREISRQFRNLKRTEQHRRRISEALRGHKKSPEWVEKVACQKRGVVQDLVRRASSLAALEKAQEAWLGSTHTAESKAAMRRTKSQPIRITRPDGVEEVVVTTLRALSEEHGITATALSTAIRKDRPIAKDCGLLGCRLEFLK